jgi:hypothetical protein
MSRSVSDVLATPRRQQSIRLTVDVEGDTEPVEKAVRDADGVVHDVDRFGQLDVTVPEVAVVDLKRRVDVYAVNAEGDIELASEGN